jgi:hypothetical protein
LTSLCSIANAFPRAQDTQAFVPLEHWRKAVLTGDAATLKSFYSVARPLKEMPLSFKTAEDLMWISGRNRRAKGSRICRWKSVLKRANRIHAS